MRHLRTFYPNVMRPPEVLQLHVHGELRRLKREPDAPLDTAALNVDAHPDRHVPVELACVWVRCHLHDPRWVRVRVIRRRVRHDSSVGGGSDTRRMDDDTRALLEFESTHPRNDRSKEAAIRDTFGYSWVRYQQKVHALVTTQAAVAAYPMVCARVQRVERANGLRAS